MNTFALQLAAFAAKAKGNIDEVVQEVATKMLTEVIDLSPVGNPTLWAANATATQYNDAVDKENTRLRDDPANLTKAGHLRNGLKINDSMPLVSGAGYVGGRFRGNWQVAFNTAPTGVLDRKDGDAAKAEGIAVIQTYNSSVGSIWMVNNLPYAVPLEYGHSTQAPAGMVRITVAGVQSAINQAVQALDK